MQLGMIGLGRMGGNIVRRLMKHGHTAVVYDMDPKAIAALPAASLILDGEVAVFDDQLVSRFHLLWERAPDRPASPPMFLAFTPRAEVAVHGCYGVKTGGNRAQLGRLVSQTGRHGGGNTCKVFAATA